VSVQTCAVAAGKLVIDGEDGPVALNGTQLRRACRCAQCRALALTGSAVSVPAGITVVAASPLGYGVQLHFSDGHNRGIFPWSYLAELSRAAAD